MRFGRMLAGAVVLLMAAGAQAQENANTSLTERLRPQTSATPQTTPRLTADEVKQLNTVKTELSQPVQSRGRSVAYMVAGAALFIGGALIGGDAGTLLMIGGVVSGAYGAYLHFR